MFRAGIILAAGALYCNQTARLRVSFWKVSAFMLMKRHILSLATAASLLAPAPPALAAPLERKDVAADPAVLFHVDFDAVRASPVGQAILNEPETKDKLASLSATLDFDLSNEVHGMTVYTTIGHPRDWTLIAYADFEPDHLVTLAKDAEGFQTVTNGAHVIYSWQDDRRKGRGGSTAQIYASVLPHRVVFGRDESHLAAALDVMDGTPPLSPARRAFRAAAPGESILAQGVILKFDFEAPIPTPPFSKCPNPCA